MKFDPNAAPGPDRTPDDSDRPRLLKPRALDRASFPGWGPKLG